MIASTRPVVGSHATYHGSLPALHGRTFLLLPDTDCKHCDDNDSDPRYTLADINTDQALKHVRPSSFTPANDQWWPTTAVDMDIAGYLYKASHTVWGGSPWARIVHYHTTDGGLRRTWCRFNQTTPAIRALDARNVLAA